MRNRLAWPLTLAAVLLVAGSPRVAQAQQRQTRKMTETHAAAARGVGQDQNVKKDDVANSKTAKLPAPSAKGGPKTRGAQMGQLHIDNRTPWYIRIYVDGDLVGTTSPYGDSYGYYGCDDHTLYARAVFEDGSQSTWGPIRASTCGDYLWRLWQ
jgi:hypothetical protein